MCIRDRLKLVVSSATLEEPVDATTIECQRGMLYISERNLGVEKGHEGVCYAGGTECSLVGGKHECGL